MKVLSECCGKRAQGRAKRTKDGKVVYVCSKCAKTSER